MIWTVRGRDAFLRLARVGSTSRTKVLWCKYLSDPGGEPLRVGYAIGRSVGGAVRRNRLRRRLRAIVRSAAPECGLMSGWVLIGARPLAVERTFEQLESEVRLLLRSAASAPPPSGSPNAGRR